MAKFDLKGLLNDRSVPDRQQDQKIVYRNPKDLIPSEENFYNTEKLERLKQSIKLLGILQPLLIENRDGKDYVIAGHCRRKCCIDLLNEGNDRFSRVPCIYKTHSELEQDAGKEDDIVRQIMIIQANCYRDKSDWEKMTETLKMEELVKELREKTPMEGKTRDILKDLIGTSNGQLGRYHAINTNLCEQLMSEFEEDRIKISVAYEASKLNREYQKQACELYEETGILTLDDIRDLYRQQEAEKGIPGQMTIETATGQNRPPEDDTEIPAETQIERFYESTNKNMKNYIIQEDKTATMVDGAEVGTYQKYITLESGNILLGHSNSKNKLKITNDSIQFKGTSDTAITPDSDATAWITGKVFHINSGEIESSLKFGKVLMKPTKNGIQIGNKAEFGERVRIGYPLSSNMQYTYSDCPLVVGSNTNTIGDYPWFAVDDGYAFVRNGIITPGDFIIKFGEYTLDRPNGGKFSGTLRPYYRADDVINMEFYVNGYVTSNKQEVIFHIPLSRPIMSTPVSISSINGLTIRQNGKYIYNSTASKPIKPASYTAAVIGGRNGLNVRAKMGIDSNGFTDTDIKNIVNNDTCAIMASIKITF